MTASEGKQDEIRKARALGYRLFKIRPRSSKELQDRLKQKSFSEPVVAETIEYFTQLGLIDDRQFTKAWIASRLNKPFGFRRIKEELKIKGIDPEIVKEAIAEIADNGYPEDEIVRKLAQKRAKKYPPAAKQLIQQRVYGYLVRRGFSTSAVMKAIKEL